MPIVEYPWLPFLRVDIKMQWLWNYWDDHLAFVSKAVLIDRGRIELHLRTNNYSAKTVLARSRAHQSLPTNALAHRHAKEYRQWMGFAIRRFYWTKPCLILVRRSPVQWMLAWKFFLQIFCQFGFFGKYSHFYIRHECSITTKIQRRQRKDVIKRLFRRILYPIFLCITHLPCKDAWADVMPPAVAQHGVS